MRDEEGRDTRLAQAFAQDGGDLGGSLHVEGGGGFVEDEHVGPEGECSGDGDAGGLPAGEVGRAPVGEVGDADGAQLVGGGGPGLGASDAAHPQRKRNVGEDAHVREDAGGLRDHGDAASARGHEG